MVRCTRHLRGYFFNRDYSRMARRNPWWENIAGIAMMAIGVGFAATSVYFGRRLYFSWFSPRCDPIAIGLGVDRLVFENADFPPAVIRMALHHFLAKPNTPFAYPMVAPEYLHGYAEEICAQLEKLHDANPAVSMPDLWALALKKSIAVLGGPDIHITWGRGERDQFEDQVKAMRGQKVPEREWLHFAPAAFGDDRRDIRELKKLAASQGFSTEDLVVLISLRNVGFHGDEFAARRRRDDTDATKKVGSKRQPLLQNIPGGVPNDTGSDNGSTQDGDSERSQYVRVRETRFKCGLDPSVFDNDYITTLLDFNWNKTPLATISGNKTASLASVIVTKLKELAGKTNPSDYVYTTTAHPYDRYVLMQGIDMSLRDDPALRGHLVKFSQNEAKYFAAVNRTVQKLINTGYAPGELRHELIAS